MVREPKEKLRDKSRDGLACPGGIENKESLVPTTTKLDILRWVDQLYENPRAKAGQPLERFPVLSFPLDEFDFDFRHRSSLALWPTKGANLSGR